MTPARTRSEKAWDEVAWQVEGARQYAACRAGPMRRPSHLFKRRANGQVASPVLMGSDGAIWRGVGVREPTHPAHPRSLESAERRVGRRAQHCSGAVALIECARQ
jgi:hypothetical protein